jgi:chaperone modulatory protein CbpM
MEFKPSDWMRLDTQHSVDPQELAQLCAMSEADIDELVEYGALVPLANEPGRCFNSAVVPSLREAARLRSDFDLDLFTVSLAAALPAAHRAPRAPAALAAGAGDAVPALGPLRTRRPRAVARAARLGS